MSRIAIVYALFLDEEHAQMVARTVIGERLAACANILSGCTSIYEWDGTLEQKSEIPALFKTSDEQVTALMARISELHSYEVPAIISWAGEPVHKPFLDWVTKQLGK